MMIMEFWFISHMFMIQSCKKDDKGLYPQKRRQDVTNSKACNWLKLRGFITNEN